MSIYTAPSVPIKLNLKNIFNNNKLPISLRSTSLTNKNLKNMKQNIVYKVQMGNDKSRSKALTIAAGRDGVSSVKIVGEEKDKVVVIGDDVDISALNTSLDKKVGRTKIVSVTVLNGNDEDNRYEEEGQLIRTNYYQPPRSIEYYYPSSSSYGPYHQPYPY